MRYRSVAVLAVLVVAWEIATMAFKLPAYILPAPTAILQDLGGQWSSLLKHIATTGEEILYGYLISIAVGIPLAAAISFSKICRDIIQPIIIVSQVIPKVVLAPLFIIWFGIGILPKLILVFLLCFFPIVLSAAAGFAAIEPEIIEFARSTGAKPWRQFALIRFPYALPNIFVGLKLSATMAVIGAVVAEFVSSDKGLGYILMIITGDLNTTRAFSVIIVLSAMGLLLYWAVERLERFVIPWHSSQQK
jgi:NitT/TauT family transport system permease protein